jgi:hypothetical protein
MPLYLLHQRAQGPETMAQGIATAIKDTFDHDIKDVLVVGF